MQIEHDCFYGGRLDLPDDVSLVIYHERCPECGQWWLKKRWRGSYKGARRWIPFNVKLWRWRRDAKRRVKEENDD